MGDLINLASRAEQNAGNETRSPARARLAAAIEALTAAEVELAAVQEPASRLAAIIAKADRLDDECAASRAAEERQLGAWLAGGGRDPRPERCPAAIAAEGRRVAVAGDAAAARTALPAAEAAFQRCAAAVRDRQYRRDEALCAAAIEAAREFAEGYRAALTMALEHEAVLHGLREELLRCGNRANSLPGALEAAGHVGQVIAETKRAAAVRQNGQTARRLFAALVADPNARLQKDGLR